MTTIKTWNTKEINRDTKEVVGNTLHIVSRVGSMFIYESDELLGEPVGEEKLFVEFNPDSMSKGEFRKAIVQGLGGSVDETLLEKALRNTIKLMRRQVGGLSYTTDYLKIAINKYKN